MVQPEVDGALDQVITGILLEPFCTVAIESLGATVNLLAGKVTPVAPQV
jgi:hypothetical protein